MLKRLLYTWAALALLGVMAVAIAFGVLWHEGFSSRPQPSELEATLAMQAYDRATPDRSLRMQNPLTAQASI